MRVSVLKVKKQIRRRDAFRCVECGMTNEEHRVRFGKQLHVHRTQPGSAYSLVAGACVTLCNDCHWDRHPANPLRFSGKVRLVVVIDEEVRDALRIESAISKKDMSLIVENLLREHLSDALQRIHARRSHESKEQKKRNGH